MLLNAQRRLIRESRSLAVICVPGPVRRLIELTRLVETLGVVSSISEHRGRTAWRRPRASDAMPAPEVPALEVRTLGSGGAIAFPGGNESERRSVGSRAP